MIRLGRFHYPDPVVVLAPMAGVSDRPFRSLCQRYGADFSVAEMVSAKPDLMHTALSKTRLQFDEDPNYPKIVQLVGGEPALMAEAAQVMQARGADVIDINMGCPAKKVGKQSAGSALLADLKQVEAILCATVNAVTIPVSVKTRLGFNDDTYTLAEMTRIAQDCGIALLSVHGRTRAQRFRGQACYEPIAEVKANTQLPVIVNGDISSAEQANRLIDDYGFDGVMIGRAAQGNPWLFAECQARINTRSLPTITPHQDIAEHIHALHALYGRQGVFIARAHLHHYYRQYPDYQREHRPRINQACNEAEQTALIQLFAKAA
ncbi:tRNA dihydrouridine synthase DusB [Suttonella sp. R2A3]|uniref:tRNA dihydrouridine synthase DusB n=1 Tax=Suttonella sp. R2A3 TaxID=2908648 RepID=UPI001F37BCBD|nr:tRNA dihydrouridine synthase DusB [Suttonella sp. R2A3]UJF24187.1 tRNA dihydrouridine synthase DusB [Suttonella sp. R2A3]